MRNLSQQAEKNRDDIGDGNPYLTTIGPVQNSFYENNSSTEIAEEENIAREKESSREIAGVDGGSRITLGGEIALKLQAEQKANSERQKSDTYFILMQQQNLNRIGELDTKIGELDAQIQTLYDEINELAE